MIDRVLLKIKRGETPFSRLLLRLGRGLMRSNLPVPRFLYPVYRGLYHLHFAVWYSVRWLLNYFYREPWFRSRCASVGKRLSLYLMPRIIGRPKIYIGDDVNLFGRLDIITGHATAEARFIVKDRVDIGHNVKVVVNREVLIEEDVNIASGCSFMDSDAYSQDAVESKPVRICRGAWIGQGTFVLKGVTIGEDAVIGVNSVVNSDIPPNTVALGNPARVVFKHPRPAPDSSRPADSGDAS